MTEEIRPDLLRGMLQSCYVIEHARAGVQRKWAGDFERDATNTAQRAERLGKLLDDQGVRRPDEVIAEHTRWFEGLCGSQPDEVALGAAVLHTFGRWSDVFAGPYLGDDQIEFQQLGREHVRVDMEIRTMTEDEAFLEVAPIPDGRRFVILTDVHTGSKHREELLRAAVDEINAIEPEFVVIPGDFTEDGEPDQFELAKSVFDGLSCPYHVVLGNHDAVQRSTREGRGEEFYKQTFGHDATDHIAEIGNLQVALVDSTDPTASPFPDWDIATGQIGEGVAAGVDSGALKPGQAKALADRLDKSRPTLLVQHHELHPFPGFPPVKFALREEDAAEELAALKDHNLVGIVAGHTHRSAVLKVGDGSVTQVEIPALKDWPCAFTVCGVTDTGVRIVPRQVENREAVWRIAKGWLPLMRRFALGPLSNLDITLPF